MGTPRNCDPDGPILSTMFPSPSPSSLFSVDDSADETKRAIKILNSLSSSYPPPPISPPSEDKNMVGTDFDTTATEKVSNTVVNLDHLSKVSARQLDGNSLSNSSCVCELSSPLSNKHSNRKRSADATSDFPPHPNTKTQKTDFAIPEPLLLII